MFWSVAVIAAIKAGVVVAIYGHYGAGVVQFLLLTCGILWLVMAESIYKYFGIFAIAVLVVGLLFVVRQWPKGVHSTFSQHVADRKVSIVFYVLLFCVAMPLLVLFFINWFAPRFSLPSIFSVFMFVSATAQVACTFIPEVGGWRTRWHRALAGVSAVMLLPASALVAISVNIPALHRGVVIAGLVAMLAVVSIVAYRKGEPKYFLLLQVAYFASFFTPMLLVAYL